MSDEMDTMQRRAWNELCVCGRELLIVYFNDHWRFRCPDCGNDPPTMTRRGQKKALRELLRSLLPQLTEGDSRTLAGLLEGPATIVELHRAISLAQRAINKS